MSGFMFEIKDDHFEIRVFSAAITRALTSFDSDAILIAIKAINSRVPWKSVVINSLAPPKDTTPYFIVSNGSKVLKSTHANLYEVI